MGLGGAPTVMHQQGTMLQQHQQVHGYGHGHGVHYSEQLEHHHQQQQGPGPGPVMDEFLDQMFSTGAIPCFDIGAMGGGGERVGWDYGNGSSVRGASVQQQQKMFAMSVMNSGMLNGVIGNQVFGKDSGAGGPAQAQSQQPRSSVNMLVEAGNETSEVLRNQEGLNPRVRPSAVGVQAAGTVLQSNGVLGTPLMRSQSLGSSGSEDSEIPQQQSKGEHSSMLWRQPYGGSGPLLHSNVGSMKPESTSALGERSSQDTQGSLGKRSREDDEITPQEGHLGTTGSMSAGPDQAQGVGVQGGMPQLQPQPLPGMGARPRVRARRGQATDPHSIAERLRRERIAERMKALQELVPNSNKTDKASMLDEIIDYVKFLQLQVKVLSMSRLGGAGALAPLVADIPAERESNLSATTAVSNGGVASSAQDGLALTERQVTRMMEEDMGSAMQYLQSKGLCLMPISLATAISTRSNPRTKGTNSNTVGGGGGMERETPGIGGSTGVIPGAVLHSSDDDGEAAERVDDVISTKSLQGAQKTKDDVPGLRR